MKAIDGLSVLGRSEVFLPNNANVLALTPFDLEHKSELPTPRFMYDVSARRDARSKVGNAPYRRGGSCRSWRCDVYFESRYSGQAI